MLIIQSPSFPARVRDALVDLMGGAVIDAEVAAAYTTVGGVRILIQALKAAVGESGFARIPKALVTSLDYGITEPAALELWKSYPNSSVAIAGVELLAKGSLVPQRAFHPKIYAFGSSAESCNLLVGSANLTARALGSNTEAVWAETSVDRASVTNALTNVRRETTELTVPLLEAYRKLRVRRPPPPALAIEATPVSPPRPVASSTLRLFRDAVESGLVDLQHHRAMWIQVERLQGGSRSQLELPRGAHKFFGFTFDRYSASSKVTIGELDLRAGRKTWNDKLLTWHGNNQMERINLPTIATGGFEYENAAILFRRLGATFYELVVVPWDSDLARAWREASAEGNVLFRLGASSGRVVGLLS